MAIASLKDAVLALFQQRRELLSFDAVTVVERG
jgi:hypothetical protein